MLVLNTNIVSELMMAHPNPEMLARLNRQRTNTLFPTATTEAETNRHRHLVREGRGRVNCSQLPSGPLVCHTSSV